MTSMEHQQQQQQAKEGANSSQDEGKIMEQNNDGNNNRRKRAESSSPPTTNLNEETQKMNGGGDNNERDDEDEILTHTTAEHNIKDSDVSKQGEDLESTKAEIGEVMEENQRLKQYLNQIMKDYQILQRRFHEISQQDSKLLNDIQIATTTSPTHHDLGDDNDEDGEFVSLSLGRFPSLDSKKSTLNKLTSPNKLARDYKNDDNEANERSLDLGLECNFKASRSSMIDHPQTQMTNSSPEHSLDETKDGDVLKNSNVTNNGEEEYAHQPPMKKARVSVRVRCDTPTMNDGCQWRKYGQKIAKGNPCPRAYYRCTVAPSCPVRKQVQRCAEDMSILITTYEGAHNHPLPVSATAMASTTSAAAYMLTSKSSTSSSNNPGANPSSTTTTTVPIVTQFHEGLKFNILENSNPNPFYSPNNSSIYSPTPTHPTVTLDLTSTTSSSPTNQQLNKITSNLGQIPTAYSSTNLTFNFSNNNSSNPLLLSWPNNNNPYISKTKDIPLNIIGSSNNTLQKSINPPYYPCNQESNLPDTFAQAAKFLTSDPNFQSILTATLSSFISGSNNGNNNTHNYEGERIHGINNANFSNSTLQSTSKETNGYASSLFSKVPLTSNSESTRSHMFLSPSLPNFSSPSTTKTTTADKNKNHTA